jgi:hypothetical protein
MDFIEYLISLIFNVHFLAKWFSILIGRGKMMVEFFSAEMELRVWRYRS